MKDNILFLFLEILSVNFILKILEFDKLICFNKKNINIYELITIYLIKFIN